MDATTQKVKEQYEAFPFPDWKDIKMSNKSYDEVNPVDCLDYIEDHDGFYVLDLGCGTGDFLLSVAKYRPNCNIYAVDLSSKSIEIAKQRLEKIRKSGDSYNIAKINFINNDINELDLPIRFDFIHCYGVLHHLPNIYDGMRVLSRHLKQGGIANIMLYSKYGRIPVENMANFIKLYTSREDDQNKKVEIAKKILSRFPKSNYMSFVMNKTYDTQLMKDAGLVDQFLHACEQSFTVPEIEQLTRDCDLKLLRFKDEQYYNIDNYLPSDLMEQEKFSLIECMDLADRLACARYNHVFYCRKL